MNVEEGMIDLQTKYAHQEHLLQTLNEVVTAQQTELSELKEELRRVREALRNLTGSQLARPEEEVPPPHY